MTKIRRIKKEKMLNQKHSAESLLKLIDNVMHDALERKVRHDRESECNDITWKAYSIGASTALEKTINLIEDIVLELVDIEDGE
jgi:hypothetical protein